MYRLRLFSPAVHRTLGVCLRCAEGRLYTHKCGDNRCSNVIIQFIRSLSLSLPPIVYPRVSISCSHRVTFSSIIARLSLPRILRRISHPSPKVSFSSQSIRGFYSMQRAELPDALMGFYYLYTPLRVRGQFFTSALTSGLFNRFSLQYYTRGF